jgi:hypothetical protein
MLTSTVRNPGALSIMRTGTWPMPQPRCSAASACRYSVWPGWSMPGGRQRLLVDRRGHHGGDLAAQRRARGPGDAVGRRAAGQPR